MVLPRFRTGSGSDRTQRAPFVRLIRLSQGAYANPSRLVHSKESYTRVECGRYRSRFCNTRYRTGLSSCFHQQAEMFREAYDQLIGDRKAKALYLSEDGGYLGKEDVGR